MDTNLAYEFNKLDAIDFKVACWLYAESPTELYDYLEFIATKQYQLKGINLNVQKVFHQLAEIKKHTCATELIPCR